MFLWLILKHRCFKLIIVSLVCRALIRETWPGVFLRLLQIRSRSHTPTHDSQIVSQLRESLGLASSPYALIKTLRCRVVFDSYKNFSPAEAHHSGLGLCDSATTIISFISTTFGAGLDFLLACSSALPLPVFINLVYRVVVLYGASRIVVAIKRANGGFDHKRRLSDEEPMVRVMTVAISYSRLVLVRNLSLQSDIEDSRYLWPESDNPKTCPICCPVGQISVYSHLLLVNNEGHQVFWRWCVGETSSLSHSDHGFNSWHLLCTFSSSKDQCICHSRPLGSGVDDWQRRWFGVFISRLCFTVCGSDTQAWW